MNRHIQLIDVGDAVALFVWCGGGADQIATQPMVNDLRPAEAHWPLNVAELNSPILSVLVSCIMQKGFVKYHLFAVTPTVTLAVDLIVIRRI